MYIVLGVFRGMVDAMDGGMNDVMKCISSCKHASKSELWSEEDLLKDKSWSSEKSQLLRDESRRMICGLSKKGYDISNSDISKNESIWKTREKDFTLALESYFISPWNYALW